MPRFQASPRKTIENLKLNNASGWKRISVAVLSQHFSLHRVIYVENQKEIRKNSDAKRKKKEKTFSLHFQCLEALWWFLIFSHFVFVWYHRQMNFQLFSLLLSSDIKMEWINFCENVYKFARARLHRWWERKVENVAFKPARTEKRKQISQPFDSNRFLPFILLFRTSQPASVVLQSIFWGKGEEGKVSAFVCTYVIRMRMQSHNKNQQIYLNGSSGLINQCSMLLPLPSYRCHNPTISKSLLIGCVMNIQVLPSAEEAFVVSNAARFAASWLWNFHQHSRLGKVRVRRINFHEVTF